MDTKEINKELSFKGIRSSGPGGQHVNKVASKIELSFDLLESKGLSAYEKNTLVVKLSKRLNKNNTLVLQCDSTRSQHRNKEIVSKRLFDILKTNLQKTKIRKVSRPTKSSILKRLNNKKANALKKQLRSNKNLY
ncbi:MAG: alternative ribosome rescue aminoacyl-tRNA hydrolase ArfB [Flavicella sp.]